MMFLGLIIIIIVVLGFILFLFGILSQGSWVKWVFLGIGGFLMSIPLLLSLLSDYGNRQKGAEFSGSYYSETSNGIDIITINTDGTFVMESDCSNDIITGDWEYGYDNFERFYLQSEGDRPIYAYIKNNGNWLVFGSELICSTDSESIFKKGEKQ